MSVAVGVMSFWRAAAPLLEKAAHAAAANVKLPPAELKEKGWDFWTIEIENLSTELKGERDRLRKQQEQLDQRAALLATEAKELAKVRSEIEQVRKTISEKIVEVSADDAKNIATLAKTYTNLTPKAVVAIVRDLDDDAVVKILSLMKVDVVSPIFEEMSRSAGNDGRAALEARRDPLGKNAPGESRCQACAHTLIFCPSFPSAKDRRVVRRHGGCTYHATLHSHRFLRLWPARHAARARFRHAQPRWRRSRGALRRSHARNRTAGDPGGPRSCTVEPPGRERDSFSWR